VRLICRGEPPLLCGALIRIKLLRVSYIQNPLLYFAVAATRHYQNWGRVNSNRAVYKTSQSHYTFEAPSQIKGEQAPPIIYLFSTAVFKFCPKKKCYYVPGVR